MKPRDPIVATLLSLFIPFYILYWFYQTGKQLQVKGAKVPNFLMLAGALIITFFSGLAINVIIGLSKASGHRTHDGQLIVLISLVTLILAIITTYRYYSQFSLAAEQITQGKLNKWICFLLFILLAPVAVYLIQDRFNNLVDVNLPVSPVADSKNPTTPSKTSDPPFDPTV